MFRLNQNLIDELTLFGLSANQAKVYLSVINTVQTTVNNISATTGIHKQDIYKILPKLQEMGLIAVTVNRPVVVKAISAEEALDKLISAEQERIDQKVKRLKRSLKKLAYEIGKASDGKVKTQAPNRRKTGVPRGMPPVARRSCLAGCRPARLPQSRLASRMSWSAGAWPKTAAS